MSERKAWNCPNCGKMHAPHMDSCPEPMQAGSITIDPSKIEIGTPPANHWSTEWVMDGLNTWRRKQHPNDGGIRLL